MSEAKKEYQKHFKLLIQQNNLNTGLRLIPNDEEILVLDIESNTINELVSIDVGESRVVMHAEEAGFTSNLISKVELYIEPKS